MSAAQDHDAAYIAEALPAFISEAQEQIASIEQLLLQLENDPADRELLDALFRCAHTVKGSAGIFGLDAVVAFTHHVETLLDRLREGELGLTPAISTLLLRCNDQIRRLVDAASGAGDEPQAAAERASLVTELAALAAGAAPAAAWTRASEGKPAQGAPDVLAQLHAVERQRAGLVGADHADRTECLDARQAPDQRVHGDEPACTQRE